MTDFNNFLTFNYTSRSLRFFWWTIIDLLFLGSILAGSQLLFSCLNWGIPWFHNFFCIWKNILLSSSYLIFVKHEIISSEEISNALDSEILYPDATNYDFYENCQKFNSFRILLINIWLNLSMENVVSRASLGFLHTYRNM